jgi:fluoroquinolone resistance protein
MQDLHLELLNTLTDEARETVFTVRNKNFGRLNLDSKKFVKVNFNNCVFSYMELNNVTFDSCTFEGCFFYNSVFSECVFQDCLITFSDLRGCIFQHKTYIIDCLFTYCNLYSSEFSETVGIMHTNFKHSNLSKSNFVNFFDCSFWYVDLKNSTVNIDNTNAVFYSNSTHTSIQKEILQGPNFYKDPKNK